MNVLLTVEWLAALVVVTMALRNVNAMTRATCHWVRLANVILAISAAAIIFAPLYDAVQAAYARAGAHVGLLVAFALIFLRGRRVVDGVIASTPP